MCVCVFLGGARLMRAGGECRTIITGGQTVLNPWPIIGGVAQSVENNAGVCRLVSLASGNLLLFLLLLLHHVVLCHVNAPSKF